jgi:glycosyltransferase involved in cell wall biosynthesis
MYNSFKLFKWNPNNLLFHDDTNLYNEVTLNTGTQDNSREWGNSIACIAVNNLIKIISNSNHFIHHIDYNCPELIYNQVVRNYSQIIEQLFSNNFEKISFKYYNNETYFYMIDAFITNSGHNLSIMLDQVNYIINNNIKNIIILEKFTSTNNYKLLKLILPHDCIIHELNLNTIYKFKMLIIIFPEFYNIYKHYDLIQTLRQKIIENYYDEYPECIGKKIILLKTHKNINIRTNDYFQCEKLLNSLENKFGWVYLIPETIDNAFKLYIYLLTAQKVIFSNGSIIYTNKIFVNENAVIYLFKNINNDENFRLPYHNSNLIKNIFINNFNLDSDDFETIKTINLVVDTYGNNFSEFTILDNKRLVDSGGKNNIDLCTDEKLTYGGKFSSLEEALSIYGSLYECKQIVYQKNTNFCFPMKINYNNLISLNNSNSSDDYGDWVSAYRYTYFSKENIFNNEKVAIIIPTFNRFEFLKKALNSCLNQTYSNIDIYITDDCSTLRIQEQDEYIELLKQRNTNIIYLKNLENKGFCKNINNSLKYVTIEKYTFFYILFDDDWIEPEFINTAIDIFKSNNEISFVEFRALNYFPENIVDYDPFYSDLVNSDYYMSEILINDETIQSYVSPGNRVFRNFGILFDETEINGIDINCLNTGSGYDFIFIYKHLLQKHKFFYYNKTPLCNFLSHENSCSIKNYDSVVKNSLAGVKYCIDNYKKIYLDYI